MPNHGGLYNYEGTIGTYPIGLTLVLGRGNVEGLYFYHRHLKDIGLRGRLIDGGSRLLLDEVDPAGNVTARFEGQFVDWRPQGKLNCEEIKGTWKKVKGADGLEFHVSLSSITGGTLDNRYGAGNDEVIHRNARQFVAAVKRADKDTVESLISYPMVANVDGTRMVINHEAEFFYYYDSIFSASFRDAIAKSVPHNMFVRDQGIMLASAGVWFDRTGKVIALNN